MDGGIVYKQMTAQIIMESSFRGIEPIYPASQNLSSKTIEKLVKTAIGLTSLAENLPQSIRERNGLCDINYAIKEDFLQ